MSLKFTVIKKESTYGNMHNALVNKNSKLESSFVVRLSLKIVCAKVCEISGCYCIN